jgi:hypothetical protein
VTPEEEAYLESLPRCTLQERAVYWDTFDALQRPRANLVRAYVPEPVGSHTRDWQQAWLGREDYHLILRGTEAPEVFCPFNSPTFECPGDCPSMQERACVNGEDHMARHGHRMV